MVMCRFFIVGYKCLLPVVRAVFGFQVALTVLYRPNGSGADKRRLGRSCGCRADGVRERAYVGVR